MGNCNFSPNCFEVDLSEPVKLRVIADEQRLYFYIMSTDLNYFLCIPFASQRIRSENFFLSM